MARLQGISGGLSGKTGSFTYRQSRGQTIVSQYQPIVKNPNTSGQQIQRAKFKLMTQLAAIMADGFGTIGITERPAKGKPSARNAFVSLNMPLVAIDPNDVTSAKIAMEQVKLTSSSRPLASNITDAGRGVARLSYVANNVQAVRFVEVFYRQYSELDTATGSMVTKSRPEILNIQDVPVSAENTNVEYQCSQINVTVLAFGLIPTASGAGKLDLTTIHTPQDSAFIAAVDLDYMVSQGQLVETMTMGVNVTSDPLA